jgi:hypothetical protein
MTDTFFCECGAEVRSVYREYHAKGVVHRARMARVVEFERATREHSLS